MKMTLAESSLSGFLYFIQVGCVRHSDHARIISGLPRKADKVKAGRHFAFVPQPDSCTAANGISIRSPRRSARAVSAKGRLPRAFEVLRLMINSSLFGNSTARSPGLAPLRIFRT